MQKRIKDTVERRRIQGLKALFKKVIRIVSLNNPWIVHEDEDEQQVSFDVQKNIAMRMRPKFKGGFLTVAEKTIIRTPHASRTIPERRKLCSLFATLRCFARLTPKMRARLVPVVRLLPISPGRNIIKKSDVPITVFFIVVGEVRMIKSEDSAGNELVEGIFGPGDVIGDVELLEGCNRTHTFKASTYCELLVLFDYDFAEILGPYMMNLWEQKKQALKALDYFDFLDNEQIVEACRIGNLKQYNPLESIYCDDEGSMTNVHFVLSGECLILQCLSMSVTMKKGKRVFRLMPTDAVDDDTSDMLRRSVRSTILQPKRLEESRSRLDVARIMSSSSSSSSSDPGPRHSLKPLMRKVELRDIENACSLLKEMAPPSSILKNSYEDQDFMEEDFNEDYWKEADDDDDKISLSLKSYNLKMETTKPLENIFVSHYDPSESETDSQLFSRSSTSYTSSSNDGIRPVYDSHFIDVGSITFGGIFGLGEKSEHRVIMARTTVQCLTLPRFFLLEKKQNPGNIWERRLLYLECMIPSREALFEHFLKNCEWKKFKSAFIRQSLKPSVNDTTHFDDIPIICRIVESPNDVN